MMQYDSGDPKGCLARAMEVADWAGFPTRKAQSARQGKLRGIGISTYVEACGLAPSRIAGQLGARGGLYESATVRVHPTGQITVLIGTHNHGQGHETTFAQIVSEKLGVPFENIDIVFGDTDKVQFGMGTYGSRSLVVGGPALAKASDKVITKGKKIAAHFLEASEQDIAFERGTFSVIGTDRKKTLADIALAAYVPHDYPLESLEPGLAGLTSLKWKSTPIPALCNSSFGRRRRRHCHQSHDRRGPAARRHHPRYRPSVVRELRLRFDLRAALVGLVHGLLHAKGRQFAENDDLNAQHAERAHADGCERLRRSRNDRLARGGHQRGGGRALTLWRQPHRHAGNAEPNLVAHPLLSAPADGRLGRWHANCQRLLH
jgi:hypothetical protein